LESGSGSGRLRMADGVTGWGSRGFFSGSGSASALLHTGKILPAGAWSERVSGCWAAGGCHDRKSNGSGFCIHLIVQQLEIF
jgi:hypothetical protein